MGLGRFKNLCRRRDQNFAAVIPQFFGQAEQCRSFSPGANQRQLLAGLEPQGSFERHGTFS